MWGVKIITIQGQWFVWEVYKLRTELFIQFKRSLKFQAASLATPTVNLRRCTVVPHQQLLAVLIEHYILQRLLYVHAFFEILQEPVEIDHVLVNALKGFVESSDYFNMILTELLISILQILHIK